MAGAVEQDEAELGLEVGDGVADRGLDSRQPGQPRRESCRLSAMVTKTRI